MRGFSTSEIKMGGNKMNHMEQVSKMLGVEFGEEFEIEGHDGVYVLSVNGLSKSHMYVDSTLRLLINGMFKIKRKPWKPKNGDTMWCPTPLCDNFTFSAIYNESRYGDKLCVKRGLAFRTKQEAVEASKKMLKALEVE